MRLPASTTQRIAAAVAIAAAGVLLPAAALAAPALSGWPAASPATAPVPACHGPRHQVWLGLGEGAAGMNQTFVPLEFSNLSPQACRLTGSPTVAVFSRHGQVGKAAATSASQRSVVLLSGETAHVILHIEFPSPLGPKCDPKMGQLHIRLGGMSTDLLGYPVAQCRNTKLNLLRVDPIHSGVGVPGFTVR
ncbi:MAG TPA: DUF4232 domain-containing protein [Streptosporangiaceae bacterium]